MAVQERRGKTYPIRFTTEEALSRILPLLEQDRRIENAYLFGSRTRKTGHSADIDIAISTVQNFSWEDYYPLYGKLSKILHSDRIDLVWMNEADPILCFEIFKNGKILFYRDPDRLNDFELKYKKRYYDYVLYLNKRRRNREVGL